MSNSFKMMALLALLAVSPAGARDFLGIQRQDAITEGMGQQTLDNLRPAYRLIEGFSDEIFDLMRLRMLFPAKIVRDVQNLRKSDSFADFKSELFYKESRFLRRVRETESISWARAEQASLLVDSLKDTILKRYQIEQLGRWAGHYAKNASHWDESSLTAGILGGAFLYLNGLHTQMELGKLQMGLDISAGKKWRKTLRENGNLNRAAGLEIRMEGNPLTFNADWGVNQGKLGSECYGFKYQLQF